VAIKNYVLNKCCHINIKRASFCVWG